MDYIQGIGMERIHTYETSLTDRLIAGLSGNPKIHVYAPQKPEHRIGVVSFTVDGFHPHEVAQQLDETADIMVRSGHHCCQPLVESLGLPDGTVRASLALYNTRQEIDLLVATLDDRALVIGARPGHAPGGVARVFGDGVVVRDEPHRNAVTPEAAGDRQAAMGAAEDYGAACAADRHAGSRMSA